mmetsp:Transcript_38433/g.127281  ORF Transcript_38433/g.127281 Transcript_38433/m.127281 type:complete len:289 (-) Transcript_38433:73-939(-)
MSPAAASERRKEAGPRMLAERDSPRESATISLHSFLAGSIAGAVGTLVGHPLDTLKVHAQAGRRSPSSLRCLFRGVGTPLIGAGALQAANLGVYENVRRRLSADRPPLLCHAAAGSVAGLCISPVTTLLSRVKVQQQLTGQSFVATARSIGSLASLFTGLAMTALFESTRGGYMLAYCLLKQALTPSGSAKGEPPLWARTAAGAGANVVTWCVVYPIDVVRNVQVAHAAAHPAGQAPGWLACVRALLREDGPARLYRGYALTILRAGPVAGVILPTFEVVLPYLEAVL